MIDWCANGGITYLMRNVDAHASRSVFHDEARDERSDPIRVLARY
jgi:hypothetical protein